ncbi:SDR family NAD(P)-dependent oxidoreductase [Streptomyces sp. KL116D]|uniref:SDR family NAD(P)-dependent oxidoreductase n=1 Tax=Streptomyces sp. KL116D TaxID=3045152 RepID=UPI003558D5A9
MKIEQGQVAVITGGASGIGCAIAEALGPRGVKLVLADIRDEELKAAGKTLRSTGSDVLTVRTDVTDADAVQALADKTVEHFGRVDLVFNNAGVVVPNVPMWSRSQPTGSG